MLSLRHHAYNSLLVRASLAFVSILAATSCGVSQDRCTSCPTQDQCVARGCAVLVPLGASYDQAYCSTPLRHLVEDDEKCSKFYGLAGAFVLGILTSIPLSMVFYKYAKEREAKLYAKHFLSRPTSEVSRIQATLKEKKIVCMDWVGTEGPQSYTVAHRGLKFFYNYFYIEFYTSDQHISARSLCKSPLAYKKYQPHDKVEVAYVIGKPNELVLVDDARLAEENPPTGVFAYILVLLLALPFVGFGFYGIFRWLCWCGYIILGVMPMVGLISGKFLYIFWIRPMEMSSNMVTVSPFTDEADTIGKGTLQPTVAEV